MACIDRHPRDTPIRAHVGRKPACTICLSLMPAILLALGVANAAPPRAEELGQRAVCEVSFVSFAWGFQHHGVYIEPSGSMGEFIYSDADLQSVPERGKAETEETLREKYRPGGRTIATVCEDSVIWLRGELNKVRYSPVTKPIPTDARDAGMELTQCWMFKDKDEKKGARGQNILLRERGIEESHNTHPAASALADWIEAVVAEAKKIARAPKKSKGCIG